MVFLTASSVVVEKDAIMAVAKGAWSVETKGDMKVGRMVDMLVVPTETLMEDSWVEY